MAPAAEAAAAAGTHVPQGAWVDVSWRRCLFFMGNLLLRATTAHLFSTSPFPLASFPPPLTGSILLVRGGVAAWWRCLFLIGNLLLRATTAHFFSTSPFPLAPFPPPLTANILLVRGWCDVFASMLIFCSVSSAAGGGTGTGLSFFMKFMPLVLRGSSAGDEGYCEKRGDNVHE